VLAADLQYALQSANPKGSPIQLYNYFDPDAADSLLLASFEQLPEARLQLVEL